MSQGVYVLRGKCPGGKCPGGRGEGSWKSPDMRPMFYLISGLLPLLHVSSVCPDHVRGSSLYWTKRSILIGPACVTVVTTCVLVIGISLVLSHNAPSSI